MSAPGSTGGVGRDQLRSISERIERLEEEKKALSSDIKDIYAEAKSNGVAPKILRKIVGLRKRDQADVEEEDNIMDVYLHALGMLPGGDGE